MHGRFQSVLVEAEAYLHELPRDMHLHPVRAGMVAALARTVVTADVDSTQVTRNDPETRRGTGSRVHDSHIAVESRG